MGEGFFSLELGFCTRANRPVRRARSFNYWTAFLRPVRLPPDSNLPFFTARAVKHAHGTIEDDRSPASRALGHFRTEGHQSAQRIPAGTGLVNTSSRVSRWRLITIHEIRM